VNLVPKPHRGATALGVDSIKRLKGIYAYINGNNGLLYFRDGSFWVLGCISAGTEQDAGTMYPTTIEDSNGNQGYPQGMGLPVNRGSNPCRGPRPIQWCKAEP
jgi:hypothetical protein